MPAAITLSNLTYALPDGRVLFSDLNFSFNQECSGIAGRNGVGKSTLLKLISGDLEPSAESIAVQARLGVLEQSFSPPPGQTVAGLFGIQRSLARLRRIEAGEGSEADLDDVDWTLEARLAAALTNAGLRGAGPETPIAELSGGQRMRARLAALVFPEPDFLLLDEPTNNLDQDGRAAVTSLLADWTGGALVVSHDRELLEHMEAIVELTSLGATRYGGNWSAFQRRKSLELSSAERELADAERQLGDVRRKTQAVAERKSRRDAAGQRAAAKGGQPRISIGLQKRRAEGASGKLKRVAERQKADAESVIRSARAKIEVLQPLTVNLAPSGLAAGRKVLTVDDLTAGYPGAAPVICSLSLEICGPERIAIEGPNGAGKSTLLKVIAGKLEPHSGSVSVRVSAMLLDQEVDVLDSAGTLLSSFRRINPDADDNGCRAALARFRFRAEAALQPVSSLSGGERLRAGLAMALGGNAPPQFLILDEPANHLDVSSLESVEAGIRAYDGALLVVSHDETFLERIGISRRIRIRSGQKTES